MTTKKKEIKKTKTTRKYTKKAGDGENNIERKQQNDPFPVELKNLPEEQSRKSSSSSSRIKELEQRQVELEQRQANFENRQNLIEQNNYYEEPTEPEENYKYENKEPIEEQLQPKENYKYENEEPMEPAEPKQEYKPEYMEEPIQSSKNKRMLIIFSIIGTIICIGILGIGIYILFRPQKYSNLISANITNASCEPGSSICYIDIKYNVNNTDYVKDKISVTSLYSPGHSINILYDSTNPDNFIIAQPKWIRILISSLLLLLGTILLVIIWWNYNKRR
jgi:hypothetical protein